MSYAYAYGRIIRVVMEPIQRLSELATSNVYNLRLHTPHGCDYEVGERPHIRTRVAKILRVDLRRPDIQSYAAKRSG